MNPVISLGRLLLQLGEVEGRKKLQKMVHILQVAGAPFSERFELSLFGAYSAELRAELNALRAEDLLVEIPSNAGQFQTFIIKAGEPLKALFAELQLEEQDEWSALAKKLNKESPQTLEGVSTVLYLRERDWKGEELKMRFLGLKPHLANNLPTYLRKAKEYVPAKAV